VRTSSLILFAVFFLSSPVLAAGPVVWVSPSNSGAAGAIAAGSLIDGMLARQHELRTTPMTHNKVGLRPGPDAEGPAKPGNVIAIRASYRASYIAKPVMDFIDRHGLPNRSAVLRAVKMLNNQFCLPTGVRCFVDADRDGDWDNVGRNERGRSVDVPYEVTELREETGKGLRAELALGEEALIYRETYDGIPAQELTCPLAEGEVTCGGFKVKVSPGEGGWSFTVG
jgi:hypothetical protein